MYCVVAGKKLCISVIPSSLDHQMFHKGFYPEGTWEHDGGGAEMFVPHHHSFRRGKYAPSETNIAHMHQRLGDDSSRPALKEHDSMPYYPI